MQKFQHRLNRVLEVFLIFLIFRLFGAYLGIINGALEGI